MIFLTGVKSMSKLHIKISLALVVMLGIIFACTFVINGNKEFVVFIRDGGTGDGASFENPMGDFKEAVKKLSGTGGTIVVCGEYTSAELVNLSKQSGSSNGKKTITVTSVYNGVDYRIKNNAEFCIGNEKQSANIVLSGEFVFENITLSTNGSETARAVICGGNKVVFGDGIVCHRKGEAPYLSIVGISLTEEMNADSNITVKSGTYNYVCAGNRNAILNGDTQLTIEGGTFEGTVSATGLGEYDLSQKGSAKLLINGGTFLGNVGDMVSASDGFEMVIKGGTFKKEIVCASEDNKIDVYGGTFESMEKITIHSTESQENKTSSVSIYSFNGDIDRFLMLVNINNVEVNIAENIMTGSTGTESSSVSPIVSETIATTTDTNETTDFAVDSDVTDGTKNNKSQKNNDLSDADTIVIIVVLFVALSVSLLILVHRIMRRKNKSKDTNE